MIPDTLRAELTALLGSLGVVEGQDALPFTTDARGAVTANAAVIVRPASTEETAATVRACVDAGVAIVPQGGNTGLSRGTVVTDERPTVILSLDRMRTIEAVDVDQWTITAQAGVTIEALHDAAAAVGRKFAPDWGARGTATLGGAIATDAGGINVLRYGNMREHVLGIEAVLADGRVWDGRRALRKDSSGYDLKQLFIGSEGTLGIVTGAVVKMVPATPYEQSALAALTDLDRLSELFDLAQASSDGSLTAFELVPHVGLVRFADFFEQPMPTSATPEYHVLLKLAAATPVTDTLTDLLSAAADAGLVDDAVVAASGDQEDSLWRMRDAQSPTQLYPTRQHAGIKLDTAVPLDRIPRFVRAVEALAAEHAPMAHCYGFGHVGDGNIHMMVLPADDESTEAFLAVRPTLQRAIDDLVFALDGTLSAEHGLGALFADRVAPQKSALEWELMRRIKDAFDPGDHCNPGKMLPPRV